MKTTRRRQVILDILKEHNHLDAYELLKKAREINPKISLSTVYRAISQFKQNGSVIERTFGENHSHFEFVDSSAESHAHLICVDCGKVEEIAWSFLKKIKNDSSKKGYEVSHVHLEVFGHCEDCKGK